MTRTTIVTTAVLAVVLLELALLQPARGSLLALAAIPVAIALAGLLWTLQRRTTQAVEIDEHMENGPAEMLQQWHARAEMLAHRADGTRADWDRHLRPLLAKEFELSTGMRIAKNRKAMATAGRLQFGPELWKWVDPADSALRDQTTRAPGRDALDEILRRLQRI